MLSICVFVIMGNKVLTYLLTYPGSGSVKNLVLYPSGFTTKFGTYRLLGVTILIQTYTGEGMQTRENFWGKGVYSAQPK